MTMGGGLGRVSNHPEYYLNDGSVSFLTGHILFRVHKTFFERESVVFRDLFESAAEDDPPSGTDARPFTLNVKPDEFAQFLWVWYNTEYSYRQQTKESWVTILRLATRWEFPKIRELAVRELEALDLPAAQRISIYREHGIDDDRLLSSYVELCKSPTLPTKADGDLMQMETLINVLQAREDAHRKAIKLRRESPTSANLEDETLREIVSRFFKSGLDSRSTGSSMGSGVQAASLNGELPHGSTSSTITLGAPQIPDRRGQSTSETGSHPTGSEKEDREKLMKAEQEKEREAKEKEQRMRQTKEKEENEKAKQAKEREERERALKARKEREEKEKEEKERQAKEREEKEKAAKAMREEKEKEEKERQAKEREEKEKAAKTKKEREEKEKQEREKQAKEEREKRQSTGMQKPWGSPWNK